MKVQFTKKIYYKAFDHRLVINVRTRVSSKDQPTGDVVEWLLSNKFEDKSWRGQLTYSYVFGSHQYIVYFKRLEILEFLQSQIKEKYLDTLEKPMNAQHTQLLESNDKLTTRKQIFFGKYRICLRVGAKQLNTWHANNDAKAVTAWCEEQFGKQTHQDSRYLISGWSKGNFYFADPKDALLFKLTWGGQDVKTERVITFDEMEAERIKQENPV